MMKKPSAAVDSRAASSEGPWPPYIAARMIAGKNRMETLDPIHGRNSSVPVTARAIAITATAYLNTTGPFQAPAGVATSRVGSLIESLSLSCRERAEAKAADDGCQAQPDLAGDIPERRRIRAFPEEREGVEAKARERGEAAEHPHEQEGSHRVGHRPSVRRDEAGEQADEDAADDVDERRAVRQGPADAAGDQHVDAVAGKRAERAACGDCNPYHRLSIQRRSADAVRPLPVQRDDRPDGAGGRSSATTARTAATSWT